MLRAAASSAPTPPPLLPYTSSRRRGSKASRRGGARRGGFPPPFLSHVFVYGCWRQSCWSARGGVPPGSDSLWGGHAFGAREAGGERRGGRRAAGLEARAHGAPEACGLTVPCGGGIPPLVPSCKSVRGRGEGEDDTCAAPRMVLCSLRRFQLEFLKGGGAHGLPGVCAPESATILALNHLVTALSSATYSAACRLVRCGKRTALYSWPCCGGVGIGTCLGSLRAHEPCRMSRAVACSVARRARDDRRS